MKEKLVKYCFKILFVIFGGIAGLHTCGWHLKEPSPVLKYFVFRELFYSDHPGGDR